MKKIYIFITILFLFLGFITKIKEAKAISDLLLTFDEIPVGTNLNGYYYATTTVFYTNYWGITDGFSWLGSQSLFNNSVAGYVDYYFLDDQATTSIGFWLYTDGAAGMDFFIRRGDNTIIIKHGIGTTGQLQDNFFSPYGFPPSGVIYDPVLTNDWHYFNVVIYCNSNTYSLYVDGNVVKDNVPIYDYVNDITYTCSTIKSIGFKSDYSPSIYVDNLSVNYTEPEERDVNIIDLPDWQGTINVESEDSLVLVWDQYCTIGEECLFWLQYNQANVGHTIYLIAEEDYDGTPQNYIDYVELEDVNLKQDYFRMPDQINPGEYSYCLYDYSGDANIPDKVYCGITIHWQLDSVLADFFSDYNCSTICDDIATGTDWFNFKYGIECGGRKLLCWGFVPDDSSLNRFANAVNSLNNSFPFSIYRQIEREIQNINLATSTQILTLNWSTFGLPLDQTMVIASSTSMYDHFNVLWDKIYYIMETIVYLSVFLYLLWRITKMSKKQ